MWPHKQDSDRDVRGPNERRADSSTAIGRGARFSSGTFANNCTVLRASHFSFVTFAPDAILAFPTSSAPRTRIREPLQRGTAQPGLARDIPLPGCDAVVAARLGSKTRTATLACEKPSPGPGQGRHTVAQHVSAGKNQRAAPSSRRADSACVGQKALPRLERRSLGGRSFSSDKKSDA